MSTYFTVEANLTYENIEALEEAVKPLREGGWLTDDNYMISEDKTLAGGGKEKAISGNTLKIPLDLYLNLGRVIDASFFNGAVKGYYKEMCEDGCLYIKSIEFIENGIEIDSAIDFDTKEFDGTLDKRFFDGFSDYTKDTFYLDKTEWIEKYKSNEVDYNEVKNEFVFDLYKRV